MDSSRIKIRGLAPGMLQHSIDGGFLPSAAKTRMDEINSMSPKAKKLPEIVAERERCEWLLGAYRDDRDMPALPSRVIRASIWTAAKLTKDGKRVQRGVQVSNVEFTVLGGEGKTIRELIDVTHTGPDGDQIGTYWHRAVVAVQRQRVMRIRPLFPRWEAAFDVQFDTTIVDKATLMSWIESAGRTIGVGDWRPDTGGEHGRFEVL